MTVPSPDDIETVDPDLVELHRTIELAALDAGVRRRRSTAGTIALGAAALLFAAVLPWTDPNARWAGLSVVAGGRGQVLGLGAVIAMLVVAGVVRPGLRRVAGGLIALAALVATAASGTALTGAQITAPGPTVALVVAPCLAVAAVAWIVERRPAPGNDG